MKKIAAILAGLMALTLPGLAQKIASPSDAQLKTVAWQDQDDRKPQGDQDDRDRKDRDKDKDKDKKDRDRDKDKRDRDDRDRDRARGDRDNDNRGDNDRDRSNGQYQDRDRNGGYYGNGQYGDRDRDRNGGYGNSRSYHNVLAPEWQQKFDSYYQRWQQYRATNNTSEMRSMEQRMQDIMVHYNIPSNVPYDQVASPGVGGYQNRY